MYLWKYELETFIEKIKTTSSSETEYYYWFIYDGLKKHISINPLKQLEPEQRRRD